MATPQKSQAKLNLEPSIVNWPETHYVFVERIGPFQTNAPEAWQELLPLVPAIAEHNKIIGYMSLYKTGPNLYRAGVSVATEPKNLPSHLKHEKFRGGKYSRFVLTGSYSNLPEASGRVFQAVAQKKIPVRDDYCIENYTNDPRTTPEEELVTEILVPTI